MIACRSPDADLQANYSQQGHLQAQSQHLFRPHTVCKPQWEAPDCTFPQRPPKSGNDMCRHQAPEVGTCTEPLDFLAQLSGMVTDWNLLATAS